VFNNNAILVYKDSSEVVIFGKGIGFGKKHGDEVVVLIYSAIHHGDALI